MDHLACYPSPLGILEIGCHDGQITSIRFTDAADPAAFPTNLTDRAANQLLEYLHGTRKTFDFPYSFSGTAFQLSVWQALAHIPYGETRTYSQIASAIGKPNAARAVGMACNRNPLWILIPCHRVIGRNRELTGYAGGLPRKKALLALEQKP